MQVMQDDIAPETLLAGLCPGEINLITGPFHLNGVRAVRGRKS